MTDRVGLNDQLTRPADRFYWAVLDAPGWNRIGPLPEALLADCALVMPAAIASLFIVGVPDGCGQGRVLACAARREDLESLSAGTVLLTPTELPPGLEGFGDPSQLNLLVGPFEPRPLRQRRLHRHAAACVVVMLAAALVCAGLVRRARHWDSRARGDQQASLELAARILSSPSAQPESILAEAQLLRRGRQAAAGRRTTFDAPSALAELLRAWPEPGLSAMAHPQTVTVAEPGASLSVALEGDPAEFLKAFAAPLGWTMDEPRLSSDAGRTRLSLALRRGAKEAQP